MARSEILEGARLLQRKGKHDSRWTEFDRLAVSCPEAEHVRPSRSKSVALQMDVLGKNAPLCFLGVWLQAALLTEADHEAYMPDWTLINSLSCFFFRRHFLWSLENSTPEDKHICVRLSLLIQFARVRLPWS